MDIKQLEYFVAVYETKNFTTAAKQINISQQGLSKSIKNLECEFNTALFLRDKRELTPTPFGKLLYTQAVYLLEEFHKAVATLEKAKKVAVPLKIGFAADVFSVLKMESLIEKFQKQTPDIFIEISNETDYVCEEKIKNGELDIAFSMGPFTSPEIISYYLTQESIYALLPQTHPLAQKEVLSISDICEELLITADTQNKGYAALLESFRKNNIVPHIIFHSNEPSSHLEFVKQNKGISLFPEHWLPILSSCHEVKVSSVSDLKKRKIFMIQKESEVKHLSQDIFVQFILKAFEFSS